MRLELTDRDKAMLPVLLLFCLIAAFVFLGIWPLHQANARMRAQLKTVRADMEEKQRKLDDLAVVTMEDEMLRESLGRMQEPLYPMMESQEIGKLLTGMALEHGLSVRRLEIRMPDTSFETAAPGAGKEKTGLAAGKEKTGLAVGKEKVSLSAGMAVADSVYHAQVLLEVTGTKEGRDGLLDALAYEESGIRVLTMRRIAARSMEEGDVALPLREDEPLPLVGGAEEGDVLELKLDISMCRKEKTGSER